MAISIASNPNPKSLALNLGMHLLAKLRAFTAKRGDNMVAFSPLAYELLKNPLITAVYITKGSDQDQLSISRKDGEWNQTEINNIMKIIRPYIDGKKMAVAEDTIMLSGLNEKPFLANSFTEKAIQQIFEHDIEPVIRRHGGGLDIKRVIVHPDKNIDVEITLRGGCSGCTLGGSTTLKSARDALVAAFNHAAVKQKTGGQTFRSIIVLARAPGEVTYAVS